jgi:hypothetical protein
VTDGYFLVSIPRPNEMRNREITQVITVISPSFSVGVLETVSSLQLDGVVGIVVRVYDHFAIVREDQAI